MKKVHSLWWLVPFSILKLFWWFSNGFQADIFLMVAKIYIVLRLLYQNSLNCQFQKEFFLSYLAINEWWRGHVHFVCMSMKNSEDGGGNIFWWEMGLSKISRLVWDFNPSLVVMHNRINLYTPYRIRVYIIV